MRIFLNPAFGLLLSLAGPTAAMASVPASPYDAAIDCHEAKTPQETAVCGDASLLAKNRTMGELYLQASHVVSKGHQGVLLEQQYKWPASLVTACPVALAAALTECLSKQYDAQIARFQVLVTPDGPFRFLPVETIELHKGAGPGSGPVGAADLTATSTFRYPQITGTASKENHHWNRAVMGLAMSLLKRADGVSERVDYKITYAVPGLISLVYEYGTDQQGASEIAKAYNIRLADTRLLTAPDIFADGTSWQGTLANQSLVGLGRLASSEGWTLKSDSVSSLVQEPQRWVFRPAGLAIRFSAAEIGTKDHASREVVIPWADLRTDLRPEMVNLMGLR
ncbi:MAG: hypothetical protein HQL37_10165 [Alphaproteobacteria bacterium]|nr:hypothetical protein [Alphaproteobacteria bacterium]